MSEELKETQKVQVVGDDHSGVSRRGFIKGGIAAVGAFIAGTAVGGFAIGTYGKAKSYIAKRIGTLTAFDQAYDVRVSHANQELVDLYKDFLSKGKVLPAYTELSHRMCHTVYGDAIPEHIEELTKTSWEEVQEEADKQMQELEAGSSEVDTFIKDNLVLG
ncbi:MAG: iron hydrogenase small subunit [Actinomycetaceae bacterium]|nr:iron hydrogenase small subunit [Actinomycetaceae bacterium]